MLCGSVYLVLSLFARMSGSGIFGIHSRWVILGKLRCDISENTFQQYLTFTNCCGGTVLLSVQP